MFPGFANIIEKRIQEAQRKGVFNNLQGSGKPLKLEDDSYIPEELRIAYKILKNADCLPQEIELKKEIIQTEDLLAGMEETAEKYQVLKKMNFLILKLNSMRNTSIQFEVPQKYQPNLIRRFKSKENVANIPMEQWTK